MKLARIFCAALCALSACDDGDGFPDAPDEIRSATGALRPSVSAGKLDGTLGVSHDGAGVYQIPFDVPAGRAGIQPAIGLTYNSRGGSGLLGVGWTLGGLSSISRCGSTIAADSEPRGVMFDTGDHFCLDGQRLVAITASSFRTVPDSFSRIDVTSWNGSEPQTFKVYAKDGRIYFYGGTPDSRLAANPQNVDINGFPSSYGARRVQGWLVSRVEDHAGNFLTVTYGRNADYQVGTHVIESWPAQIDYTGHNSVVANRQIVFQYDTRPDPSEIWQRGVVTRSTLRLARVSMYAPPTPGAVSKQLVRSYQIGYDTSPSTRRSRVTSVKVCDGGTPEVCLPATTFSYSIDYDGNAGPRFTETTSEVDVFDPTGDLQGFFTADFNGDGRDDLLYQNPLSAWQIRYGQAGGLGAVSLAAGLPPLWRAFSAVQDLDGDGRVDVVAETLLEHSDGREEYVARIYKAVPTDATDRSKPVSFRDTGTDVPIGLGPNYIPPPPQEPSPAKRVPGGGSYMDLTGDLRGEFVYARPVGPLHRQLHVKRPDALAIDVATALDQKLRSQDLDGDGRAEILGNLDVNGVQIWRAHSLSHTSNTWSSFTTNVTRSPCNVFADVNGDGLVDAIDVQTLTLRFNTGGGQFGVPVAAVVPGSSPTDSWPRCDGTASDAGWRVVDLDGDGRQDLLALGGSTRPIRYLRSVGHGLKVIDLPHVAPPSNFYSYPTGQILDVDGDGLLDFLRMEPSTKRLHLYVQKPPCTTTTPAVCRASGEPTDVIVGVTDGFGARDELVHKNLMTSGAYSAAGCDVEAYPTRCVWGPMTVVVTERRDNGASVVDAARHEYATGRADALGEGWVGFASHKVTDVRLADPVTTIYRFDQRRVGTHYPYHRDPAELLVYAKVQAGQNATWTKQTFAEVPTNGARTRFVYTQERRTKAFEGAFDPTTFNPATATTALVRTQVMTTSVDSFGNPLTIVDDRGDGFRVEQTVAAADYLNDTASWIIGKPKKTSTTGFAPSGQVTRTEKATYDPVTGLLTEIIREPDAITTDKSLYLATTLVRDSRGLIQTIKVKDADGNERIMRTGYDADYIHETSQTNALDHVTSVVVHPGLGVPLSATDANNLTVTHDPDGFGRPNTTTRPDGSQTTVAYWSEPYYRFNQQETERDGALTQTRTDRLGRPLKETTKLIDDTLSVVETTYDAAGRVEKRTRPRRSTDTAVYYDSQLTYDALGRLTVKAQHVASRKVTYSYAGRTFTEIDENNVKRLKTQDGAGHVIASFIYPNGVAEMTQYVYGPFDVLLQVWEPPSQGQTTPDARIVYDRLGRVLEIEDRDRGLRKQTWSAFGEILTETDALGRVITYSYDALGRRKTRIAPDDTNATYSTWSYDPPQGKGKLGVTSMGVVQRTFTYDALSRLSTTKTVAHADQYVTERRYDTIGRLQTILYPVAPLRSRFTIEQRFGANGEVNELVEVSGTPRTIWKASSVKGTGQIEKELLNGIVETTHDYDPATGLVTSLKTRVAGIDEQNVGYTYFANGNLETRKDLRQSKTETFAYDGANRLRFSTIGAVTTEWVYDARGNLLSTTEPGYAGCNWNYGTATKRSHALTSIVCGTTTYSFGYDGNGHVTSIPAIGTLSAARTVTPSLSGKPTYIQRGSYSERYGYDADEVRAWRWQGSDLTHYVGPELERRKNADGSSEYLFYVLVGDRVIAQHSWRVAGGVATSDWTFYHEDLLGSVELLTNAAGNGVTQRLSYDVWGRRRNPDWTSGNPTPPSKVKHGFTGHRHDDEVGLIDMGGRVYEPTFKRFLSPDPLVQSQQYGPSWNRYSYVFNNPLRYVDPTGFEANLAQIGSALVAAWQAMTADVSVSFAPNLVVEDEEGRQYILFPETGDMVEVVGTDDEEWVARMREYADRPMYTWVANPEYTGHDSPPPVWMSALAPGGDLVFNAIRGNPISTGDIVSAVLDVIPIGKIAEALKLGSGAAKGAEKLGKLADDAADASNLKRLTAAEQLKLNKANGRVWEKGVTEELRKGGDQVVEQVHVRTVKSRTPLILDNVEVGALKPHEAKSSATAGLTKNQKKGFPEGEVEGFEVRSNKPGLPRGTILPPQKVEIHRPK